MALSPRAKSLIERLTRFVVEPRMFEFRRAARIDFVKDYCETRGVEALFVEDHTLYVFRSPRGLCAIDYLLNAPGGAFSRDERAALERMRANIFGLFQIEELRPGRGFLLRRCGTAETYEVVDTKAAGQIAKGECVACRLGPYGDHHEIAGPVILKFGRESAAVVDRLAAETPATAAFASDPRTYLLPVLPYSGNLPGARNRLDAELFAARVFADIGLRLSVDEARERLRAHVSIIGFLAELEMPGLDSMQALDRYVLALLNLWQHTPRKDDGGKSPAELRAALKAEAAAERRERDDVWLFETDGFDSLAAESGRRVHPGAGANWLDRPYEALDGLTPARYLGIAPALPPEEDMPPRDRPAWTVAALQEKAVALAAAGRVHGLLWVLGKLDRMGAGALPPPIRKDDGTHAEPRPPAGKPAAGLPAMHREPDAVIRAARNVAAAFDFPLSSRDAASVLAMVSPEALTRFMEDRSVAESRKDEPTQFDTLLERDEAPSEARIREILDATNSDAVAGKALAFLILNGSPAAVRDGAARFFSLWTDSDGQSELASVLVEELRPVIAEAWFGDAFECLTPEGKTRREPRLRFAPLAPRADDRARARASAVFSEERARRIEELTEDADHETLIHLCAELVIEAAELAWCENPRFEALGRNLAAVAEAARACRRFNTLPGEKPIEAAALLLTFAGKAVRGRDVRAELAAAPPGAEPWDELLAADEPWLSAALFPRVRAHAGRARLPLLVHSGDRYVQDHAALLLASLDPAHFAAAMLAVPPYHCPELIARVCSLGGDELVDALCTRIAHLPPSRRHHRTIPMLAYAGTERARRYFELLLDMFAPFNNHDLVITCALEVLDRDGARRLVEYVRRGGIDSTRSWQVYAREETRLALRTLIDVHELDAGVETVIADAIAAQEKRVQECEDRRAVTDEYAAHEAHCDSLLCGDNATRGKATFGINAAEMGDVFTIRNAETPIGRNAPCPCGSGKKHKKCCGA
ncbi:MAG TPA: hypothetical protein DCM87_08135 [Planctomycetes bacterium]|nr:hypothetical protein [Planctomycetota bacterium]